MLTKLLFLLAACIPAAAGSLAFFAQISQGNIHESRRLLSNLYRPPPFAFAIHVDAAVPEADPDFAQLLLDYASRPNVVFMPRRGITYRGVSMLLNTLDGLATLLTAFPESSWHHAINLSGSDYPLMRTEAMARVLGGVGAASFVSTYEWDAARPDSPIANRFLRGYIDPALGGRPGANIGRGYGAYPPGAPVFPVGKGEAWVTLSRAAARRAAFSSDARWLQAYLVHTVSGEESFFQTLLGRDPAVVNMVLTFIDWKPRQQHPNDLELGRNFDRILRSHLLFARKMVAGKSDALMDALDAQRTDVHLSAAYEAGVALKLAAAVRGGGGKSKLKAAGGGDRGDSKP